jgi:hypothetical protein
MIKAARSSLKFACLTISGVILFSALFPCSVFAGEVCQLKDLLSPVGPKEYFAPVGAENIHSPGPGSRISALLALPDANRGHIEDFNSYGPNKVYPERFTVSDGTILTPFIYVDMTVNSPLQTLVTLYAQKISEKAPTQGEQLNLMKTFASDNVFAPVPENDPLLRSSNSGLPTFPEVFSVGYLPAGHFPIPVAAKHQSIAFERLIKYGRGYCIHKVLLTSLIMKELKIPHSVRFGSTGFNGHSWIELTDGRILDPTWNLLMYPQASEMGFGWSKLGNTSVYQFNFYPFAVWNPLTP